MKIILILSLSIFLIPLTANAVVSPEANVVSTSYVKGAVDAIDTAKQDKLTSTNVTSSGDTNGFVSAVTASNGTVSVVKTEITIPVGSANSATRAQIWVQ